MSNLADELRDAIALVRGMDAKATKAPWEYFAGSILGNSLAGSFDSEWLANREYAAKSVDGALIVATRNTLAASLWVMDAIRQMLEDGLSNPYLELQVRAWCAAVREACGSEVKR